MNLTWNAAFTLTKGHGICTLETSILDAILI